jgi:hypothetical protein
LILVTALLVTSDASAQGCADPSLTRPASGGDVVRMKAGSRLVLMAMLALRPICVFAGGTPVYIPNPVGEKLYRAHLFAETLPIAIIAGGLLLAWLLHAAYHKAKKLTPDEVWSYDI